MMSKYEKNMLDKIQDKISYLMECKGYNAYDISCLIDDFIFDNDFSNECNKKLWELQDIYIELYRESMEAEEYEG